MCCHLWKKTVYVCGCGVSAYSMAVYDCGHATCHSSLLHEYGSKCKGRGCPREEENWIHNDDIVLNVPCRSCIELPTPTLLRPTARGPQPRLPSHTGLPRCGPSPRTGEEGQQRAKHKPSPRSTGSPPAQIMRPAGERMGAVFEQRGRHEQGGKRCFPRGTDSEDRRYVARHGERAFLTNVDSNPVKIHMPPG